MIMSMTGFGKGQEQFEEVLISAEIKSVNSRFLETYIRLPRHLSSLELEIKEKLKKYAQRGKINININLNHGKGTIANVKLDHGILNKYLEIIDEISMITETNKNFTVTDILSLPDIVSFEVDEAQEEKIKNMILGVLEAGLESFNKTRAIEGAALAKDMMERLDKMITYLSQIELLSKEVVKENVEKLKKRLNELTDINKLDDDRLETEIVFLADRLDITEEIVRLKTHIIAFKSTLENDSHSGKKLNFLAQEMHREANTIGSKSAKIEISHLSVSLKEEIERIREQVQNIE